MQAMAIMDLIEIRVAIRPSARRSADDWKKGRRDQPDRWTPQRPLVARSFRMDPTETDADNISHGSQARSLSE